MSSTTTASTDSPTLPRWRSEFTATIAVMFEIPVSPPVNESNSRTRSASTSVNPSDTMASPSPPRRAAGAAITSPATRPNTAATGRATQNGRPCRPLRMPAANMPTAKAAP